MCISARVYLKCMAEAVVFRYISIMQFLNTSLSPTYMHREMMSQPVNPWNDHKSALFIDI